MEGKFIEVTLAKWHGSDYPPPAPNGSVALLNIASVKQVVPVVKVVGYPKAQSKIAPYYVEESYDEIKAALNAAGCTVILLASEHRTAKEAEPCKVSSTRYL